MSFFFPFFLMMFFPFQIRSTKKNWCYNFSKLPSAGCFKREKQKRERLRCRLKEKRDALSRMDSLLWKENPEPVTDGAADELGDAHPVQELDE